MGQRYLTVLAVAVFIWGIHLGVPETARGADPDLPLAAGICVNKALGLIQAKKPGEAATVLRAFQDRQKGMEKEEAHKKGYTHYYIDFLLGNCLMMMDKGADKARSKSLVADAEKAYARAVSKNPGLSAAWLNLAQCRYTLGDGDGAAHAFIRGYDTSEKKEAQHLYYGAACYFFAKAHGESLDVFYRLLKAHGPEVKLEWKETLVNTLFALDRNREALPWLEELAKLSKGKKQKQWREVLLYQYLNLGMDKKALAYARYLTRNDSGEPKWWKALAHIHLGKNRLEKGLQSLMIYGFLTPLSPEETRLTADLFLGCNIPLEAARYYEAWLEQAQAGAVPRKKASDETRDPNPRMVKTILKIARAHMRGGDRETAMAWADKGLALKKDPKLLRFKADLLFREKAYEAAGTLYEDLAESKGKVSRSLRGRAWLMSGYAAWNTGDLDKAARSFERAARFPKQKKNAKTALAQVRVLRAGTTGPVPSKGTP